MPIWFRSFFLGSAISSKIGTFPEYERSASDKMTRTVFEQARQTLRILSAAFVTVALCVADICAQPIGTESAPKAILTDLEHQPPINNIKKPTDSADHKTDEDPERAPEPTDYVGSKVAANGKTPQEQRQGNGTAIPTPTQPPTESGPEMSWADKGALANVISALMSFITTILLGFTLWVTLGMLREARATTAAATASIDMTRDLGQTQIRAYLQIKSVQWIYDSEYFDKLVSASPPAKGGIFLAISAMNSGASPAINAKLYWSVRSYPPAQYVENEIWHWNPTADRRIDITNSGATFMLVIVPEDYVMAEVAKQHLELEVSLLIEFEDVFGRAHECRSTCYICGKPAIKDLPTLPDLHGFPMKYKKTRT